MENSAAPFSMVSAPTWYVPGDGGGMALKSGCTLNGARNRYSLLLGCLSAVSPEQRAGALVMAMKAVWPCTPLVLKETTPEMASRGVKLFPRTLPPKVALPGLFEESPPPHPTTAAKMRTETIRMGIPLARIVARHRGPPEPLNWRGGERGLRGCARRRAKGPRDRPIA